MAAHPPDPESIQAWLAACLALTLTCRRSLILPLTRRKRRGNCTTSLRAWFCSLQQFHTSSTHPCSKLSKLSNDTRELASAIRTAKSDCLPRSQPGQRAGNSGQGAPWHTASCPDRCVTGCPAPRTGTTQCSPPSPEPCSQRQPLLPPNTDFVRARGEEWGYWERRAPSTPGAGGETPACLQRPFPQSRACRHSLAELCLNTSAQPLPHYGTAQRPDKSPRS